MKIFLIAFFTMAFLTCCGDNVSNTIDPSNPSDFQLDVLVYDNGSGIVVVSAKANNAVEYHFYMGAEETEPFVNTTGQLEYKYRNAGAYLIVVRAYGASGRYMLEDKRVIIESKDPIDVSEGYATPLSYDGYELTWNDEFNGTTLNQDNWSYDIGTGCPDLCGWGNNELEYYRAENCSVDNGVLTLQAREVDFQGSRYTSGKVVTRNKQGFQYGRIDIRAIMPKGQGIWPALWMLGTNQPSVGWPKCGEIDIMEMIGGNNRENRVSGNAFWDNNGVTDNPKGYILETGFFYDKYHVYTIIWDEASITWFVDDVEYHSLDITTSERSEFHNPFYMIFNVAVGGNWPGSPDETTSFPTEMSVDYVRVFSKL